MNTPDISPQLPDPASVTLSEFYGASNEQHPPITEVNVNIRGVDHRTFLAVRTAFRASGLHGNSERVTDDSTNNTAPAQAGESSRAVFGWRPDLPPTLQS